MSFLVGAAAVYTLPASPLQPPQPPQPPPSPAPPAADGRIVCLCASLSGRLVCAVTSVSVWLFSALQGDCVCLGGWKRHPALQQEEGDNEQAAFNAVSAEQPLAEAEAEDEEGSGGEEAESSGGCVLAVLTSRRVLNILRIAHRPDLLRQPEQQRRAASKAAASAAAAASALSSLSVSGQRSSPPPEPVSCLTSPALLGFPSASWHDACSLSAAVHHPCSLHLLSRVKLSNDAVSVIAACADGFLLGTEAAFTQRVALDGRPVSCVHLPSQLPASPSFTGAAPASAVLSLSLSSRLSLLAFVLADGRVGLCPSAVLDSSASASAASTIAVADSSSGGQWLQGPPGQRDSGQCVALHGRSQSLAVGWRSGCVQLYRVQSGRVTLTRTLLPPPACAAAPAPVSLSLAFSPSPSACIAVCWAGVALRLLDLQGRVLSDAASASSSAAQPASDSASAPLPPLCCPPALSVSHSSLCWSGGGHSLLCAGWSPLSPSCFLRYSCYRLQLSDPGSPHSLLISHDRILVSRHSRAATADREEEDAAAGPSVASARGRGRERNGEEEEDGEEDDDDGSGLLTDPLLSPAVDCLLSGWDEVVLPPSYSAHCGAIRHCALSRSGEQLAVSAAHGLCIFNRRSQRWRRFGNVYDEWSIAAQQLAWHGEQTLLVSNSSSRRQQSEFVQRISRERLSFVHAAAASVTCSSSPPAALSSASAGCRLSSLLFFPRSHLSFSSALHCLLLPPSCRLLDLHVHRHSLLLRLAGPHAALAFRLRSALRLSSAAAAARVVSSHNSAPFSCSMTAAFPLPRLPADEGGRAGRQMAACAALLTDEPNAAPAFISTILLLTHSERLYALPCPAAASGSRAEQSDAADGLEEPELQPLCADVSRFFLPAVQAQPRVACLLPSAAAGPPASCPSLLLTVDAAGLSWWRPRASSSKAELAGSETSRLRAAQLPLRSDDPSLPHCPVAVCLTEAAACLLGSTAVSLGAAAAASLSPPPAFVLGCRRVPVLHSLLAACLSRSEDEEQQPAQSASASASAAWVLARCCRDREGLLTSLELLLHEAVDGADGRRLEAVLDFLRARFPSQWPQLLARVARKHEAADWQRLFPSSSSPRRLALGCLLCGELHTAALYLLIVQRTETAAAAHKLARRLLLALQAAIASKRRTAKTGTEGDALLQLPALLSLHREVERFHSQTAAIVSEQRDRDWDRATQRDEQPAAAAAAEEVRGSLPVTSNGAEAAEAAGAGDRSRSSSSPPPAASNHRESQSQLDQSCLVQ